MSTSVYVYSVDADRLRAVPGSKDKELLAASSRLEGYFKTIDKIAEHLDEDEDHPVSCAAAYRHIVNGEPYAKGFGYVYGYAYEGLCMALGTETESSWTQIARSWDWFKEIDAALATLGIKLNLTDLLCRGPLINIPTPDDFPALGWWTAEDVASAVIAFTLFDLNPLQGRTMKEVERVSDAIEDIRSWIAIAADRQGNYLIGVQS
jgi:hypothetical protein